MGNQQNRSRSEFISNIHSFAEIKKVIDESNLILSNTNVEELFDSRISIKLLTNTEKLESIQPSKGFLQKTLWKYYLGRLSFLVIIIRGGGLEYVEINFLDFCELLEKLLTYVEFVSMTEKHLLKKKAADEKIKQHLCAKCLTNEIKIYLPCYHGFCEICFEKWKENLGQDVKCLICDLDIAYDKSFVDGKVFVLENDFQFLKNSFKEQIKAFFQEKKIKWVF